MLCHYPYIHSDLEPLGLGAGADAFEPSDYRGNYMNQGHDWDWDCKYQVNDQVPRVIIW